MKIESNFVSSSEPVDGSNSYNSDTRTEAERIFKEFLAETGSYGSVMQLSQAPPEEDFRL